MSEKVLITGASGLIGSRLTNRLQQKGYQVLHLTRQVKAGSSSQFEWNPEKGTIDLRALEGVSTIIHLAGAGIADERWSAKRKKLIRDSRTQSTRLLFDTLNTCKHQVKQFISASAIGYYGFEGNDHSFHESDAPGQDFLASVVKDWESEIDEIKRLAIRCVKVRIGIVLSLEGGALPEMMRPIQWGVGAPLGTGRQHMSWIHIDDLIRIFLFALENPMLEGPYNAVAPHPVTNKEFTKVVAKNLKRPVWLPPIPGFVLKIMVGEMADLVINGSIVSSDRIEQAGYRFEYPHLQEAVANLLKV